MQFKIGKCFGIPVSIDLSWFIIFGLIVVTLALGHFPQVYPQFSSATNWAAGVAAALLLFASVLIHELAHSLVAKREGIDVGGITLFVFGGVSNITREPVSPGDELKMAAAGPGMSFVLAGVFWGLGKLAILTSLPTVVVAIAGYLAAVNLILGIFNLIPGFPLDGGRVLRAILWAATRSVQEATRIASYVGQGFGYLFMFGGFWMILGGGFIGGLWLILIGWFLSNAAHSSYQQLILHRALEGVPVDRVMTTDVPTVSPSTSIEDVVHDFFLQKDYSAFPVVEDGQLLGIVTLEAVREVPREMWPVTPVSRITHPPEQERIIHPEDDAWSAMSHMATGELRRLLVMSGTRLVGVVTRDNLMNLVRTKLELGIQS